MSKNTNKSTDYDPQIVQNTEVIDVDDPAGPSGSVQTGQEPVPTPETPEIVELTDVSGSLEDQPTPEEPTGQETEAKPEGPAEVEDLDHEGEAEAILETSEDEMDESEASILDAELLHLLRTPLGLRGAVEALLFSSPEPLTARRIAKAVGVSDIRLVSATLQQLQADYDAQRRGLQIIENTQGFQMATRELFGDLILNLRGRKRRPSLSQAALETLAIVAYRQPIIRAEVEAVRGVESSGTIRNLIDMGLVEMVGRKDVIGRPPMYGTTETFLNAFGIKQIEDLPSIGDLKRHAAEEEKKTEAAEIEKTRTDHEKAEKEASAAAEAARAAREQAKAQQNAPEPPKEDLSEDDDEIPEDVEIESLPDEADFAGQASDRHPIQNPMPAGERAPEDDLDENEAEAIDAETSSDDTWTEEEDELDLGEEDENIDDEFDDVEGHPVEEDSEEEEDEDIDDEFDDEEDEEDEFEDDDEEDDSRDDHGVDDDPGNESRP